MFSMRSRLGSSRRWQSGGSARFGARFRTSRTHLGEWLGVPATGRRFESVDEIYIFGVQDGRLVSALGVEDNLSRLRQLGITPQAA